MQSQQPSSMEKSAISTDTTRINKLIQHAIEYNNKGQPEQTILYSRTARQLAEKISYKKGITDSYVNEGRALFRQSKYTQAIACLKIALLNAQQNHDLATQSSCLNGLGISSASMGDHTKALTYYLQGLAIEEKLPVQNSLPWYYCNIGNLYNEQKNFEKALEYSYKALDVEKRIPNERVRAIVTSNLGVIYSVFGKNDSALFFYKRSHEISEQSKDTFSIANSSANIASMYLRLKRYPEAELYNLKSYKIAKEKGYDDILTLNIMNMALIDEAMKNYDSAEQHLLKGIAISKKMQSKLYLKDIFLALSRLYVTKKDYQNANRYYKLFSEVKDSILNQENSKLITEMNTKYTTEKKEKEIELLRKNEDIQKLELSKRKNELNKQQTVSTSIFIGFVLLMIVAVLIFSRYRLKKKANEQLQVAFDVIEEKNNTIEKSNLQITDSITYAKRIQDAILPAPDELYGLLSDNHFILYKPAHIVSGDFYWCSSQQHKLIFIVADCTGHGVPGAFMSMIGNTLLNEIVNAKGVTDTKMIADLLDEKIIHALHQNSESDQYDGMDISICCIDKEKKEIGFTGANHSLLVVTDRLQKFKGDSYAIGGAQQRHSKKFTCQTFAYETGTQLYLLTDGYCDQSGGNANKRFTTATFGKLLTEVSALSMELQKQQLEEAFENWKGTGKQRDDVLVVGIRL